MNNCILIIAGALLGACTYKTVCCRPSPCFKPCCFGAMPFNAGNGGFVNGTGNTPMGNVANGQMQNRTGCGCRMIKLNDYNCNC